MRAFSFPAWLRGRADGWLAGRKKQVNEGATQQQAPAQVAPDGSAKARVDYEAELKERNEKIEELENELARAAKTAESTKKLCVEINELRRAGNEQRVGFELTIAGHGT